jgi:hypothetical protein
MEAPRIFVPLKKIEPNKPQNILPLVKATIKNQLPVIIVVEPIQSSREMFCKIILVFICS